MVGCQLDADARRDPLELLFPAGVGVSYPGTSPLALDRRRGADHWVDSSSAADWCRRLSLPLAGRAARAAWGAGCRGPAAGPAAADATADLAGGDGRDHCGSHLQLQLLDPLGSIDDQLEWRRQALPCGAGDAPSALGAAPLDPRDWADGGPAGIAGPQRPGALVSDQRSGLRPPLSPASLGPLRFASQPDRLDRRLSGFPLPAVGRRGAALWLAALD